ncbi:hypothetical protein M011DRAFT_474557 [Sporormia fimetaria CBS 119925]|uniref:Uncharacterized protein n=1 Tax=Sporormia fimetaria CBS 119925 TaxID=1340428 RepID=A0A6A6VJU0_9PLEO|nr:hypothetical protein M011DRAFT_474557 [Sporormia fimetaria CBS 119925]
MALNQSRTRRTLDSALARYSNALDHTFPPERRQEMRATLREFAAENPKLAFFIAVQFAFSGLPLLLFLAFVTTAAVFSATVALVFTLLTAFVVTLAAAGVALLVLLPTLFLTTFAASFLFAWAMGGYYGIEWVKKRNMSASSRQTISNRVKHITSEAANKLRAIDEKKPESRTGNQELSSRSRPEGLPGDTRQDVPRHSQNLNATDGYNDPDAAGVKVSEAPELGLTEDFVKAGEVRTGGLRVELTEQDL